MTKRALVMPLLVAGMVFFMQCSEETILSDQNDMIAKAGKGGPGGGGGGGDDGGEEAAGNNLSFPVITADGYQIAQIPAESYEWLVPYTGDYSGLTAEDFAALGEDTWYAQKVEGNVWQADFDMPKDPNAVVNFIDWGDVIEAVSPTIGRPFRVEVTLYTSAASGEGDNETMTGYTMALLENPSSPDEVQGNNTKSYESDWATIVSARPRMAIQAYGTGTPVVWNPAGFWEGIDSPVNFSFAPELNVGGKYIYGASEGGWRPAAPGKYRLTFYMPLSQILFSESSLVANFVGGNFVDPETAASTPQIDVANNLSYVDVTVVTKGGGGGGSGRRP